MVSLGAANHGRQTQSHGFCMGLTTVNYEICEQSISMSAGLALSMVYWDLHAPTLMLCCHQSSNDAFMGEREHG